MTNVSSRNTLYLAVVDASRVSGYNSDYLTQLCRKNKLNCIRKAKVWFVNFNDLLNYIHKSGKTPPDLNQSELRERLLTVRPSMGGAVVFSISGRDYISSDEAAKISGYNRDYLTEMARDNEIPARKLGKIWFFDKTFITGMSKRDKYDNKETEKMLVTHKVAQKHFFKKDKEVSEREVKIFNYITENLSESIPRLDNRKKKDVPIKKVKQNTPSIHNQIQIDGFDATAQERQDVKIQKVRITTHKPKAKRLVRKENKSTPEKHKNVGTYRKDGRYVHYRSLYINLNDDKMGNFQSKTVKKQSVHQRDTNTYQIIIFLDLLNIFILVTAIALILYANLFILGIVPTPFKVVTF